MDKFQYTHIDIHTKKRESNIFYWNNSNGSFEVEQHIRRNERTFIEKVGKKRNNAKSSLVLD